MLIVLVIPPGPRWMILQLLMLSVVPWIVGSIAAGTVTTYLLTPRWRFVLIAAYIPLLLVTWAAMWRVLVTSWR